MTLENEALQFKNYMERYNLIGYGADQIITIFDDKDGTLKKKLPFKKWSEVSPENWTEHILCKTFNKTTGKEIIKQPKSFCIRTGKDFNCVAIDFDTQIAYDEFIKFNPECKNYLTQKTKKGFHIIFNYHEALDTSISNDSNEDKYKIDFRSNGGIIISFPTQYKNHSTGEIYKYEIYNEGQLGNITEKIIKYFDDNNIKYTKKKDTSKKLSKVKTKADKKVVLQKVQIEEQVSETISQNFKMFQQICQCFTRNRVCNYSSWFEIGCLLKNHFHNKDKDDEGYDAFVYFSKLSNSACGRWEVEGAELPYYSSYNVEEVCKQWNKIIPCKLKKSEKNKNWDKIKKLAKIDNPELFEDIFNIEKLNLTTSYSDLKTAFEETNFKLRNPVCFCEIINVDGEDEIIMRNKTELTTLYENVFWTKYTFKQPSSEEQEGKWIENERLFVDDWRTDINIKTYERIDFMPYGREQDNNCPNNIYNLFSGLNGLKYYNEYLNNEMTGKLSPDLDFQYNLLHDHIWRLCGNDEFYNYTLDWLAYKIQYPNRRNNIALIFKSLQGIGKDTFFDWFGKGLIGEKYYLNIQGLKDLDNFNALLSHKLLVIINEFEIKDSISNKEKLKTMITNKMNVINEKFEKQRKEKNYVSFAFLTNNDNSFYLEMSDRRNAGTEGDNSICNDINYFRPLFDNVYGLDENDEYVNKDLIGRFFNFLMQRDVSNKDWVNTRPQTEYYKTLKEASLPIIIRFFEYMNSIYQTDGASYLNNTISHDEHESILYGKKLFDLFKKFKEDCNFKADYTSTAFGLKLKEFCVSDGAEYNNNEPKKFMKKIKTNYVVYHVNNKLLIKYLNDEGLIKINF